MTATTTQFHSETNSESSSKVPEIAQVILCFGSKRSQVRILSPRPSKYHNITHEFSLSGALLSSLILPINASKSPSLPISIRKLIRKLDFLGGFHGQAIY